MPILIEVKILWSPDGDPMSYYTIYRNEIEEIMINYDIKQLNLFTFLDDEIIRQWIWDVFCREPKEIIVEQIIYN